MGCDPRSFGRVMDCASDSIRVFVDFTYVVCLGFLGFVCLDMSSWLVTCTFARKLERGAAVHDCFLAMQCLRSKRK